MADDGLVVELDVKHGSSIECYLGLILPPESFNWVHTGNVWKSYRRVAEDALAHNDGGKEHVMRGGSPRLRQNDAEISRERQRQLKPISTTRKRPLASGWKLCLFEKGQLPLIRQGVVADNPLGPFNCFAFEIAVFRGQPAIKNRDHFQPTVPDLQPSRCFLATVARITFDLNTHGGIQSIASESG
jgi:hypothetical protein